jgi:hypothetical protein
MVYDGKTVGLFIALFADALEIDLPLCYLMSLDFSADIQTFIDAHLVEFDIIESAAGKTLEMAVKRNIGVIADLVILYSNWRYQAFFRKCLKRVVDGCF